MNAPCTISRADALATAILAGDPPPGENELYDAAEWTLAALYAVDGGDYSDIRFMAARELAFDDWCRLSERTQDAWVDFENWWRAHRKHFDLPDLPGAFPFGDAA